MPGPLPGMDPYLEGNTEWRDVHEGLITYMRDELNQRMPRIAVPLSAGESDITLDLQKIFDRNYDAGAYARFANYNVSPDPPFSPEFQDWAFTLLREKGVRQA